MSDAGGILVEEEGDDGAESGGEKEEAGDGEEDAGGAADVAVDAGDAGAGVGEDEAEESEADPTGNVKAAAGCGDGEDDHDREAGKGEGDDDLKIGAVGICGEERDRCEGCECFQQSEGEHGNDDLSIGKVVGASGARGVAHTLTEFSCGDWRRGQI